MTRRRQFVNAVTVSLLTGPAVPWAQAPGRLYRLGILRPTGPSPLDVKVRNALRELGHVGPGPRPHRMVA